MQVPILEHSIKEMHQALTSTIQITEFKLLDYGSLRKADHVQIYIALVYFD